MFASMFILVGGVQANALTFGREVIIAGSRTRAGTAVDPKLQKFFAVMIVTFVCQLQAYSRLIYIRMSNALALFKVSSLIIISLCGILAICGVRREDEATIESPYGRINLEHAFSNRSTSLYQYSLALLNVMRAFLGYENANLVCPIFQPCATSSNTGRRFWRRSERGLRVMRDVCFADLSRLVSSLCVSCT